MIETIICHHPYCPVEGLVIVELYYFRWGNYTRRVRWMASSSLVQTHTANFMAQFVPRHVDNGRRLPVCHYPTLLEAYSIPT